MASWSKDELPDLETGADDDWRSVAGSSTLPESMMSSKVKVYDRRSDSRADRYRLSICPCDKAAVTAVIQDHRMSLPGMQCRITLDCTDDDPFNYVFVEALQLLQDWLSHDQHFTNVLRVARWDKRDNLADLLRSFGDELIENRIGEVQRKILYEVLKYHRPCLHARILFEDLLRSDVEAMVTRLLDRGFELIASRFDDHVIESRAASGRDMLKCLFNIIFSVITDYSYYVDVLSTAIDSGHETVVRNTLQKALMCYQVQVKRRKTEDICQRLFNAAVRGGNCELVRILLQLPQLRRHVHVNSVIDATITGDTAVHLACRMGSTLISQTFDQHLCQKAVHVAVFHDSKDDQKYERALSVACRSNYYRFVAAAAASDECRCSGLDGWRLMAMSSEMEKLQLNTHFEDYVELTQLLIQHGADLYARNKQGETALHVAASLQLHGHVLLEVYALCPTAICPTYVLEYFRWKLNCGLLGTLKTLEEKNLQNDEREMLFTCIVCELFSPSTVKQLNAVVSSYFENVLSLIRTLLQAGMDVNFTTALGDTALSIAANEASKCIAFCRQMNMSTSLQERERAAEVGEFLRANIFTVVRELLGHNADWQIGRSNRIDLLNVALHSNQTDLLVELVCQGAEPKSWPEYLILVFESETQSVVVKTLETLSSVGVTVDITNDARQTALHIAAERDLPGVVSELIYVGADTEAVDVAGRTPLQSAVESGSSNAIVAFQSRLPAGLISTSNSMGRRCVVC